MLTLRHPRRRHTPAREDTRHLQVEIRGREFDRVARHHTGVEAVEPAGMPVVPCAVRDDRMFVYAEPACLGEGAVGHLVHAHRTRCRTIDLEGPQAPAPPPVRARHGIAGALGLRERREQRGGHHRRRVTAKDRRIAAPRFRRRFVEYPAHREEQLGRLADDLVRRVREQQHDERGEHPDHDLYDGGQPAQRTPGPAAGGGAGNQSAQTIFFLARSHRWAPQSRAA